MDTNIRDIDGEIWKPVYGFSKYHISSEGRLKTFNHYGKGKTAIMKPAKDSSGYLRTMIIDDNGKYRTVKMHRVVVSSFLKEDLKGFEVNHKNAIKTDNRICNLEKVTRLENLKHSLDNHLQKPLKGEEHGMCKLTELEVLEIRSKYIRGFNGLTNRLAEKYGVSRGTIQDIVYNRSWKHLK